ncbi:AAA family ATPase [Aspergillus costaricaensis CBS 115574]|uniref:AAA family ATPase n=1 Tax=Aspergillus costaricaensis CBS 115574 TaxID=1448317 RepID=A0ACD1HYP2_9EURO|nr:AAA family ATPase [Aspergillus costaricaensis CBS 115574]RAK83097.1 AAA family ATPase [Aspergillus costaricaensis CBS 115574]
MATRSDRLSKHLVLLEKGKRQVTKPGDAKLLLEALCGQDNHLRCIERVLASPALSDSLQNSFRLDLSPEFINNSVAPFLSYIQHPSIEDFGSGQFLRQMVSSIIEPPTFWNAFVQFHSQKRLSDQADRGFAWLLLKIISTQGCPSEIIATAQQISQARTFLVSSSLEVRTIGYRIDGILKTLRTCVDGKDDFRPGGRHDNDFECFRDISILPTPDEIASTKRPFYRRMDDIYQVSVDERSVAHYDNQFRLLREDMLAELKSDLQLARGQRKGRRSALTIYGLQLTGVSCGEEENRRRACSVQFECTKGIPGLSHLPQAERQQLLSETPNFLKPQTFGCLLDKMEIVGFASLDRRSSDLTHDVPTVALSVSGDAALYRVLACAKMGLKFAFLVVNTPIFAYEPILLRLQSVIEYPLSNILLAPAPSPERLTLDESLETIVERIRNSEGQSLHRIIHTTKSISLDKSQLQSLLDGLQQSISTIQGPPGTGKSFLGALIAKTLHDETSKTLMIICYTNHALDQFLEDLLDIGIPTTSMVRLGSKSTPRTKDLGLFEQSRDTLDVNSWSFVSQKREELEEAVKELQSYSAEYSRDSISKDDMLEYLEFSEDSTFFDAFTVPEEPTGMQRIGRRGKSVGNYYLWDAWRHGRDPGALRDLISPQHAYIWTMAFSRRRELMETWQRNILFEKSTKLVELVRRCNVLSKNLDEYFYHKRHCAVLGNKRIVACTTNAAARYAPALQVAKPDVVIVEEAGEILESHILTAMTMDTQQLVLIGDHKQLRPKINNYNLSVEKGDGLDLNRSLFERLISKGYPHSSLTTQHRMRPEISRLVRHLTYPDLQDSERTCKRPPLRGFQTDVVFVNHCHLERELHECAERRDPTSKASKQNPFEVEMTLKVVKYLGQQGYGTEDIVILTPYLGQLSLLRTELSKTNDPVLNNLDANDLIQAGLRLPGSTKVTRDPIRISTIDNYQGEERNIVIASLTRSNEAGDIGFMAAPERVNVLLSRARNALVMIGNASTFLASRKGQSTWKPLLEMLQAHGQVYDGVPLKCETHPDRMIVVQSPETFEKECPDGGCSDPCSTLLPCGLHSCIRRCHRALDHKRMKCIMTMHKACPKNHNYYWECSRGEPKVCPTCDKEAIEAEQRRLEDAKLEEKRRKIQLEHAKQLAEIQYEIEMQRERLTNEQKVRDHQETLAQKQKELESLTAVATRLTTSRSAATKESAGSIGSDNSEPKTVTLKSAARDEWERQKTEEGQSNAALDTLMDMIGLERVKDSLLAIKAKVDVVVRQGASLSDERFGAALLGNPGTGKTTVARLYAEFLGSVGVIPGSVFIETSGSKLANAGIAGCQKHLNEIKSNGGGALFIDEAYQLTSGNNAGGSSVLDFLLAEVENLTGKVMFILAGYNKNMESFFAHNPGIPSRFPIELKFQDYSDEELRTILHHHMNKKYKGRMRVEDGPDGLYMRIVARRVGRGRGREGFGNARSVHNAFARITERQAKRLQRERRLKKPTDDLLLTKEDLLGPDPRTVLKKNATWDKLQALTGLRQVKQSVQALFDTVSFNYQRELEEKPMVEFSLNKVFVGNPGTGKTTVAKLYGKLLAEMGYLSNGEVVVKNPSDFIGNAIGGSEAATKGILASTLGKVLVIDEAYMLGGTSSSSDGGTNPDIFKTAVIDTLVAEVQSVPGDDRCVLLLGYRDAMERMFQTVNEGLSRRFPMSAAFDFEDFTDDDLQDILNLKLKGLHFSATAEAKSVVRQCLSRARNRPNFGNAGEVDILLDKAKLRHQQRLSARKTRNIDILEPLDFDPDFDREQNAVANCRKLFHGVVGCEQLVAQLEGYQNVARNMKRLGLDSREKIPFNFLFRGPPGSGKTSTARRMGQVFYDMGILGAPEVVECSSSDLVAQYVGQTGPKTERLLEKGLGRVLFIDEAGHGPAGGLFDKGEILQKADCYPGRPDGQFHARILASFEHLSTLPGWGNGRDVKTISDTIIRRVFSCPLDEGQTQMVITEEMVSAVLQSTVQERQLRATATVPNLPTSLAAMPAMAGPHHAAPSFIAASWAKQQDNPSTPPDTDSDAATSTEADLNGPRDPGVSNEVWDQLQADRKQHDAQIMHDAEIINEEKVLRKKLDNNSEMPDDDERRQYEELIRSLVRQMFEIEERKKKEEEAQRKLREMGVCPMGYRWIPQATGYRCAGGSHFVSSAQLGL